MLVDEEDSTRYLVGECFLHIPNDEADQKLGTGPIPFRQTAEVEAHNSASAHSSASV
jgi:hypothetical protein